MGLNIQRILSLGVVLSLVFIAGCAEKPKRVKKAKKAEKTEEVRKPLLTKEDFKVERETYNYDPKGRRDPFVALIQEKKEKPKRGVGASPLENFDVEEIKLIAIAWDDDRYYALITLPDNKSFTITKGAVLGLYGGKVEEITESQVLIREQITDYKGDLKVKDKILSLRQEGEQ